MYFFSYIIVLLTGLLPAIGYLKPIIERKRYSEILSILVITFASWIVSATIEHLLNKYLSNYVIFSRKSVRFLIISIFGVFLLQIILEIIRVKVMST